MSAADLILKNFQLFADGKSYLGNCPEFTPPSLKIKEEDYKAGGMDAPIAIDMGMEKLEAKFTLTKFDPSIFSLWGLMTGAKQFTARGTVQGQDGATQAVVINITGNLRQIDFAAWKAGEKVENTFMVSCIAYKYTQAGLVVHDIDIRNMKRVVNGFDQLAAQRANIGL